MNQMEPTSALTCFVIGPIGNRLASVGTADRETYEESLRVMEEVIAPACATHGLTPVRADGLARAGEITEQIFVRLRDDDVVIADLTGANPNVMYELGLRHTRGKLTVQIGEFGRLPFDVNIIRTIQFSRSPIGLINARDELTGVLASGLAGDYDPVTATRLWGHAEPGSEIIQSTPTDVSLAGEVVDGDRDGEDTQGFLDVMAFAEEQQEELTPAMEAVASCIVELGELSTASAEHIEQSDAAGKGMRGRLQVAARYASGLDTIADRLETVVDNYASVLAAVSDGNLALIGRMEADPDDLETGREFGMTIRQLAEVTREGMASLAGLLETIKENARMARILQTPSRRLTVAMNKFVGATSIIDEWDRRLQALGIPQPAEDWEADWGDEASRDESEDAAEAVIVGTEAGS